MPLNESAEDKEMFRDRRVDAHARTYLERSGSRCHFTADNPQSGAFG